MESRVYAIGPKVFEFRLHDVLGGAILTDELSAYPEAEGDPDVVVSVKRLSEYRPVTVALGPAEHCEFEDGFGMDFGHTKACWHVRPPRIFVDFYVGDWKPLYFRKFSNIQYAHYYESIGQKVHEQVIVPTLMLFFSEGTALIHGAVVETPTREALAFTGAGGVGKTSVALELVLKHGFRFMADDISFVQKDGTVWANFAYPKIYAYNTVADRLVAQKVASGRGLLDSLQWFYRKHRCGLSAVRRRIDPRTFFDGSIQTKSLLSKVFFLFRQKCERLEVRRLHARDAVLMSLALMRMEMSTQLRHVCLHEYSRVVLGNVCVSERKVFEDWRNVLAGLFQRAEAHLVQVPLQMTAKQLRDKIVSVVQ